MRKTKEEIDEFYEAKKRIEDYHAMQNKTVLKPITNIPERKSKQKVDDWL